MIKTHLKTIFDLENILSKVLLLGAGVMDNKDLSNNHVSGQPFRYLSAFFVPKICLASQARQTYSITLTPFLRGNRHISKVSAKLRLPKICGWEDIEKYNSLLGEYSRRLLTWSRVIPNHPMTFHSVVLTQNKTSGGH